jgi:hypothetical protein
MIRQQPVHYPGGSAGLSVAAAPEDIPDPSFEHT